MPASRSPVVEFKSAPVLYLCSSKSEIAKMVEEAKRTSKGENLVLLLNHSERAVARVLPAFINAAIRFNDGSARSDSMQIEMLMLVCGTMNIGKALRDCGAKDKGRFLVFASSRKLFDRFARTIGIGKAKSIGLKLDKKTAGSVAITELLND